MTFQTRPMQFSNSPHEEWENSKLRSKTHSTSSAAYSVASTVSSRQTSSSAQEASAKIYFMELEKYLAFILSKEASEGVLPQRTAARQKLSKLNNLQFHELATDVYDELIRRNIESQRSFLPLREDYHPRRNQARQKLATLPSSRFTDLASDVYYEIRRRYPQATANVNMDQQYHHQEQMPSLPNLKPSEARIHPNQSTNIIPIKGTINVESISYSDDENENGPDSSIQRNNNQSIDSLMADLGNMVNISQTNYITEDRSKAPETNPANVETTKREYELKIQSMAKRIQMLELSIDSSDANMDMKQPAERDRQMRMNQMQDEYQKLDSKYLQLSKEHKEQQVAVQEVKSEIKQLIDELKNLSSKNETLRIQNEKSDTVIKDLTEEAKSWKTKFESANVELRNFKVRSMQIPDNHDLAQEFFLKPNSKGAVGQQYILEYQAAIDELMRTSRSSKPADVLFSMRTIVLACKTITTEVEEYEVKIGLSKSDQASLYDIKQRFSNELANLLNSAKSYANGMGISPVSLLDFAAGNLTTTIVDLVKLMGMRPMGKGNNLLPGPNTPGILFSNEEKDYISSGSMSPKQLSDFLKTETDHIVSSVQNLLGALRSNEGNLFSIITSIMDTVFNIVNVSKNSFNTGEGLKYKNQGDIILSDLDHCNTKIAQIRDASFVHSPENANAIAKRNLAQESYEIAKFTKELINMLDV